MDVSAAQCEVSATTENTQNIEIDRSAVVEFIKLLAQQYSSGKRPRFAGTGDSPTRRMAGTSLQQLSSPAQPGVSRLLAQQQQQQQQKGSDLGGDKFIDLLNNMNKQMDSLRSDFLTALEDAFFGGEGAVRTSNSLAYSRVADVEYQQKAKALTRAEERLKAYESRIGSLEKALQQKRLPVSNERSQSLREGSSVSSTYSILEDEGKKADADELEKKLLATEKRYGEVERRCTELVQELDQHKDALRKRNALLESMNEDWASEQEEWRKMKEKLEQEKEEMRLQIQELEQLLEEERQTYEENRRSFLREVQIQDNLADIRVAGVEDDWRSKMQDLEKQLEQERQENERLRVEHQKEIERLEKKSRDEQAQAQAEKAELQDVLEKREEHYAKLESINQDTEQAREDIKRRFAQAREMVANAENSWREKQQLLDTVSLQET
ncbi:hypothetical protein BCR43DRAFT_204563 [Syncephalastrum racemosum]|uniref:Uncharacterized protein n=1 Tax=Syncephalastrum racemosum TaxID=13706 RepID=A0A1X2HHZ1_SYNRA|nr:hypothetical protein BCR43DRAFT_204563 [Syncephalastrum racemosum]